MNALAQSILAAPADACTRQDGSAKRRRRRLEAALLAQPLRSTTTFQPYASSGFHHAVRAREKTGRTDAA